MSQLQREREAAAKAGGSVFGTLISSANGTTDAIDRLKKQVGVLKVSLVVQLADAHALILRKYGAVRRDHSERERHFTIENTAFIAPKFPTALTPSDDWGGVSRPSST